MTAIEQRRHLGPHGCRLALALVGLAAAVLLTSCSDIAYLQAKVDYQDQVITDMENKLLEWKDAYDKLLEQKVRDNEEFQKQTKNWEMERRRLTTIRSDRERELLDSENKLKLQLQAEMDKYSKLRKELDGAQSRITLGEKDLTATKAAQSKLDKDLASARSQIETLNGQLQAAQQGRQTAEQRARTAENEAKEAKSLLAERDQKIKDLEGTAADLQTEVKAATEGKTTMSALVASLRKQLAEEKKIADDERQKYKTEISRLSKELASLRGLAKGDDSALAKAADELSQALSEEVRQKTAEVISSYDRVTVRIRVDALFEPATLVFLKSAQTRLRQIADILAKYPSYQLRVDGHTDNQPVRDMPFPDNLALSSQRANNVLRFLTEATKLPQKQIRATGCADSQPIASNDTAEGRQRNRRVEIILLREE